MQCKLNSCTERKEECIWQYLKQCKTSKSYFITQKCQERKNDNRGNTWHRDKKNKKGNQWD